MIQALWDLLGFPLRAFILDEKWQRRLGLTTLLEERVRAVRAELRGRAIDIGCGSNRLMREWRAAGNEGVGVDVHPFEGADKVVDSAALPFADGEFDTAVLMACLNHVPSGKRGAVLKEACRTLKPGGRLLVTMIDPFIGWLCHKLTWWDYDQEERGMARDEAYGLSRRAVLQAAESAGFALESEKGFVYGLNRLYVFVKK